MTPDLIFEGRPAMAKRDKQEQKPANREAIAAALAATLPTDRDELLAAAVSAVVEIDAAIMRGDDAAAELAAEKHAAIIWKMNGGTHFGNLADDDAPGRVIEAPLCGGARRGAFVGPARPVPGRARQRARPGRV